MAISQRKSYVIGVGMTNFTKPRGQVDYPEMAREAVVKALLDIGNTYDVVQQAYVGYCFGDSTCGQRAVYQLGMTQIPVINVNNNCSTGSTALYLARQAVEFGIVDCALALGFEKMTKGSLANYHKDRTNPIDTTVSLLSEIRGITNSPFAAQIFGNAGIEYCENYGATAEHMAKIGEKNHRHSANNPYSQFKNVYTLEEIKSSPQIFGPLTKLQCCPTSDGSAAVIVASEKFVIENNLQSQAIEIVAQAMATDSPDLLEKRSSIELAGVDMTRKAAKQVYEQAGISADDIQVVELHDCFSANELITYDALGLCKPGQAHKLVDSNDFTYGGKYVINPSGGLISKGHPLGATGLAQCAELVWQLRGWCTNRQVPNLKYALQHNIGLGGAVVVSVYKLAELQDKQNKTGWKQRFGYNPAIESRGITEQDFRKVCSKQISEYLLAAKL
ncbi:9511_t:CDS:2 [Funneliformis geosporum]|uniref:propanoyl-CoA C-acyltransferase n=1 Tax=Funneliformis geosporum TaxID=1117311 RepID=A0A9W4X0I7_9GLOM|nr:9511_t:CDS:2 [Funneliformis geosporum]CAI2177417.1 15755_t:CDS:2 [Funneliformis geosporum]